jgi:hypothetical protein
VNRARTPQWDQHILRVFSVFAGLALSQAIQVVAESKFQYDAVIVSFGVFFVVLDCWYHIHKDLSVVDIEGSVEVIIYILLITLFCCLPYLYTARAVTDSYGFLKHELFLLNLAAMCGVDMIAKGLTIRRLRTSPVDDPGQRDVLGKYMFFMVTDGAYAVILLTLTWISTLVSWSVDLRASLAVALWLVVRATDKLVVARISGGVSVTTTSLAPTD